MALAAIRVGLRFDSKDLKPILYQHTFRHGLAAFLSLLGWVMSRWVALVHDLEIAFPRESRDAVAYAKARATGVANLAGMIAELSSSSPDAAIQDVARQLRFWNDANSLKLRGLYVDWDGTAWVSPETIDPSTYEESAAVVADYLKMVRDVVDALKSASKEDLTRLRGAVEQASLKRS